MNTKLKKTMAIAGAAASITLAGCLTYSALQPKSTIQTVVDIMSTNSTVYRVVWKNDEMPTLLKTKSKKEAVKYIAAYKSYHDMYLVMEANGSVLYLDQATVATLQ